MSTRQNAKATQSKSFERERTSQQQARKRVYGGVSYLRCRHDDVRSGKEIYQLRGLPPFFVRRA
jgi:hypothetical protein